MRSDTTIETLNKTLTFPAKAGSATVGRLILTGQHQTKWMTKEASKSYFNAVDCQVDFVHSLLAADPYTRQAVIHGPLGACWVATQLIRDNELDGHHLVAMYRSMDTAHLQADIDLQTAIGHVFADKILSLTFHITSYHTYK